MVLSLLVDNVVVLFSSNLDCASLIDFVLCCP